MVKELLQSNFFLPSHSPFASLVMLVKKKDAGWHFYMDYRGWTSSPSLTATPYLLLKNCSINYLVLQSSPKLISSLGFTKSGCKRWTFTRQHLRPTKSTTNSVSCLLASLMPLLHSSPSWPPFFTHFSSILFLSFSSTYWSIATLSKLIMNTIYKYFNFFMRITYTSIQRNTNSVFRNYIFWGMLYPSKGCRQIRRRLWWWKNGPFHQCDRTERLLGFDWLLSTLVCDYVIIRAPLTALLKKDAFS